jgi:hypothetical protein
MLIVRFDGEIQTGRRQSFELAKANCNTRLVKKVFDECVIIAISL